MRLVEVLIPAGRRNAVLGALDDEGIDYAVTDETSSREFTAVVTFPVPTNGVEHVLARLREAGIDEDSYTVVLNAETVVSRRFERLEERFSENGNGDEGRIAREEIHTRAADLAPEFGNYVAMTVISAVVATAGVLVDSPAVVVGSMVIAPLVGPAMATSVGTVVDDPALFRRGAKLQVLGVLAAVVSASAFAVLVKTLGMVPPTLDLFSLQQFSGRLSPDFLSLAVALGAGVAGAISIASGVSIALVGVMIAAALIPPVAVVGIGIAWGQPMTVLSSGVLVLVNVLSINLSALAVLWYKGYRPENWFRQDAARSATLKRIAALAVAIAVLSVFLGGVTYASYQTSLYEGEIQTEVNQIVGAPPYQSLSVLEIRVQYDDQIPFREPSRVVVTVGRPVGEDPPNLAATLYEHLNAAVDRPNVFPLDASPAPETPIDVQVRYVEVQTKSANQPQRLADARSTQAASG
ncbi:TIGR00341 family protein [Halegenticoccus soli]|uniref:TIGR00341 family protein n=1 Tax=Halegenticoccus soli TaxID=1985678 RepID=UPI000C6E79FD|nr:TIGR00341 family protein [Halegenticoccus soli]